MKMLFAQFFRNESGSVLIEYGFILTLISIGIIGSITAMGGSVITYINEATAGLGR